MRVELQLTPTSVGSQTVYVDLVISGGKGGGRYVAAQGQMSAADAGELAKLLKKPRGVEVKYMEWASLARSP